ncbi:MAG: hypothetical protein JRH07_15840 [Deltaproteobacteria bacterium]|nr:hypothetical protein [Deltaproteobacteria bacterium]MBW2123295.1 hypothetical protein [Deltaproteobacteria bacterium]
MTRREPYRRWSVYLRDVAIWLLLTVGISIATLAGISKGIFLAMDYFLKDDRFYSGVAASAGISACGTVILFTVIFLFIQKVGRYPRRRFRGLKGI